MIRAVEVKDVLDPDHALREAQAHCRREAIVALFHEVVVGPIDVEELLDSGRVVRAVAAPDTAVVARGMDRPLQGHQKAPELHEIAIDGMEAGSSVDDGHLAHGR